jgi:predicted acetyltransferase
VIQVRTIDVSELADWIASMDVGFLHHRDDLDEYAQFFAHEIDPERTWAALDSQSVVGTLRSFATTLTVPGPSVIGASALTNVTVAPTHRRRGLMSRMMTGDLSASIERGDPLAVLIASEYPIYGRFGFGAATFSAGYTVDTRAARFHPDSHAGEDVDIYSGSSHAGAETPTGTVGHVELIDLASLRKEAPAVYDGFRVSRPGSIVRDDSWWDRHLHQVDVPGVEVPKGYGALYRSEAGAAEGYVRYDAESNWTGMRPGGVLTVDELVSLSRPAYGALWRFCCDMDLVTSVNASGRPVDEVLPWLLVDARAVRQTMQYDFLWVRILDVCAALSSRRYTTDTRVVLEVSDPLGIASGRYLLDGGPVGASCALTKEPAELWLGVEVLGSVYLGGVPLTVVADGARVRELRPGALEKADIMFRSVVAPWCATWF